MTNQMTEKRGETPERLEQRPVVAPPVDIFENREQILVLTDLPGVRSEDLSVRLEKNELHLYARRHAAAGRAVDFARTFVVPRTIDPEKIDASLKDGVLTIRLPKNEAAKPRQIAVRAS